MDTRPEKIPFNTPSISLSRPRFRSGVNSNAFYLKRKRKETKEDLSGAVPANFWAVTKARTAGDLRGIQDIGSGRLFIVKPYGLAQYDTQTGQAPKFP